MTDADDAAGPVFRSDVDVELVSADASDGDVVRAARVSTLAEGAEDATGADPDRDAGLVRYLLRSRHGTPFEHATFTFRVAAPIFVFREFQRHRVFSYNEESARYRELRPVFYVPARDRRLVQVGKAGAYTFEPGTDAQHDVVERQTREACTRAHEAYRAMLDAGVAREVARGVLPVATYSSMYVTGNARAWLGFLSLRTARPDSAYPSSPQREIEMVAEKIEEHVARLMPVTHAAYEAAGRVAP